LQNLLAERFKLAAHREAKEMPVDELTVAKGGPKFKAWSPDDERKLAEAAANPGSQKVTAGADGYAVLPAGVSFSLINNGHARLRGEKELMPNFAERLSGITGGPVLDATGLKGEYAFTLSWIIPIPGAPAPPPDLDPGPDLFTALQEQLGLKLDAKRAPVEMLVVDHAEKIPVEN
jgi:uncharacterized protein (TIGR03435 family)